MKSTRPSADQFTTMKLPSSLLHQLHILAARKNKYMYQVIAEMIVYEIESLKEKTTE